MPPRRQPSWLARLFGAKRLPEVAEDNWQPSKPITEIDVDKAWHGIHFLLTGTDWDGEGPLAFIVHGGQEISEALGYGYPHGFTSNEVKAIDEALRPINADELYERAEPAEFARHYIYPEVWTDEPKDECIGYVTEYFQQLKQFVAQTAATNRAMIVYLG